MKPFILSLNPTYLCNFRCEFCYLTPAQLADKKRLDPGVLRDRLAQMRAAGITADHIDLYGGEISLLPEEYLDEMDAILSEHGDPSINVVSNLSKIHPYFLRDHVHLSASFDFEARRDSEKVLSNMAMIDKDLSVLVLASPKLMEMDVPGMIKTFNGLENVISVEIKPYSSNQANDLRASHESFENFVKKWIECPIPKKFEFVNANEIRKSLAGTRNAFSDDHVYITPEGRFAVLEFDGRDRELFLELDSFDDYLQWRQREKEKVGLNSFCSKCEYFGRCLTEHYRHVESVERSCNGYYKLLKWSETNL